MTVSGDFENNKYILVSNFDNAYGLFIDNTSDMIVRGNFSNNEFMLEDRAFNTSYALRIINNSSMTVLGKFFGNDFTLATESQIAYGITVLGGSTFEVDSFSNNDFMIHDTDGSSVGLFVDNSNLTISNNFSDNTFTISDNGSLNVAISITDNTTAIFNGLINNNKIFIDDTASNFNAGFRIETNIGQVVNFNKAVKGNTITVNPSSPERGDFYLDTSSGGTINFKGNTSQGKLSSSNNDAFVNPDEGSGTICYGSGC